MKTKPSKIVLRTRKLKNLWSVIWVVSATVFLACNLAIGFKMGNLAILIIWLISLACLLISILCMQIYTTRLSDLEIRNSHPAFRFHDWFMENKDELIKNGTLVPLDELIKQQKEKGDSQSQE